MNRRIVVVDDEALVRMNFVELLEENGYEVVGQAADGVEAIKVCQATIPDAVLMDIEMPLLDGFSAAKKIFADQSVKGGIIYLSAYSSSEHIKKASELGVGAYLVKPLDEKSLIPTLECVIAKGKEATQLAKEVARLSTRLEDRKVIEQAKGLLMKKNGLSESQAYKMLRDVSMKRRMSMRELADMLVLSND